MQAIANVLNSAGEAVPFRGPPTGSVSVAAAAAGVPVIGIRAVGRGALADVLDKQVDDDHPIAVDYRRAARLRRLAKRTRDTRGTVGLPVRAVAAGGGDGPRSACANRAELADAISAERDGPLDPTEMAKLRSATGRGP